MKNAFVKTAFAKIAASIILLVASSIALPHHSFSAFNNDIEIEITGEVVEFQWTNPHSWVWVNVTNDDGSVTLWGLEGMSPNYLGRRGWTKKTFVPGDIVNMSLYPLRNGEPGGMLVKATMENGDVKVMFGEG